MMCRERLEHHEGPVLILAGDSPDGPIVVPEAPFSPSSQSPASLPAGYGQKAESLRLRPNRSAKMRKASSPQSSKNAMLPPNSRRSPKST